MNLQIWCALRARHTVAFPARAHMSHGFPFFLFIALVVLAVFFITLCAEVLVRVLKGGPVLLDPKEPKKKLSFVKERDDERFGKRE